MSMFTYNENDAHNVARSKFSKFTVRKDRIMITVNFTFDVLIILFRVQGCGFLSFSSKKCVCYHTRVLNGHNVVEAQRS